ncbi:hypothetical protein B0T24DRAFT_685315 [Lasiosphaeria ovina]|uniref:BHLH domain-containing protein n=1 Tax=Lasiosphaeria ovina TaxID=92902 RepID=A0AAE0JTM6_9PEZI|nr:hypothetical protein B0T24DRAFT_685315 [Lasiosphaeria ovina]
MTDQDGNQRFADEKKRLAKARRRARRNVQENARRHNCRQGFERLSALIPGAEGHAAAERVVLQRAADYIQEQLGEREDLIRELEARGETVDPALKTEYLKGPRSLAVLEKDEMPGYQEA